MGVVNIHRLSSHVTCPKLRLRRPVCVFIQYLSSEYTYPLYILTMYVYYVYLPIDVPVAI